MDKKEGEFLKRLLATFKIEAKDHLDVMASALIELEKLPSPEKQMEIIENIYREAHSLKGAARAVNMTDMGNICQLLESVFAALKRREIALSSGLFKVLYQTIDGLAGLSLHEGQTVPDMPWVSGILYDLENILKGILPKQEGVKEAEGISTQGYGPVQYQVKKDRAAEAVTQVTSGEDVQQSEQEELKSRKEETKTKITRQETTQTSLERRPSLIEKTVRISTARLHSIMLQAEELVSAKLIAAQRVKDLRDVKGLLDQWKNDASRFQSDIRQLRNEITDYENQNKKPDVHNFPSRFDNLLEFFHQNETYRKSLEDRLLILLKSTEQDQRSLGGMVDNLHADTKKLLMLPFSSLLEGFPRVVRELSKEQGKNIELVMRGGDIEIDRRILEEMKDPFMHMVRNCIDHGIEKPDEREKKNKPSHGTITIAVSQKDSGKVEVLVFDDGAGIDAAAVRATALKLGIISQEEAKTLDERETLSLIFRSGISTSPIITDISGRGLGLAIVQEKVEKLGGIISLETAADKGTTFKIILPMTIATFLGVLVRTGESLFIIPTIHVEQVIRVKRDGIKTVENRETILLNERSVSLVRLDDTLELPGKGVRNGDSEFITAVVLGTADRRIAFIVDQVLNEQEVLVKGLGKQLFRVRNIAGSTVLGTGKVVPILNVFDLMKSAVKVGVSFGRIRDTADGDRGKKKSVLIAEDSITSRMLLKNILETAGYHTIVAVDGVDALTTLKTEDVDLVVSDIDMPRMNGFDLTTKIRGDTRFAELPVVLVTALDSREDRERGIDVGANAYIVKSSFDQSNLLEIIKKLI